MSINRVTISGNLTRDGELRATASGTSVLTFGVAVNDRRRNTSGEWEDYPNFIDCVMFGTRADSLARYLTKGTKVCIDGKLRYSSWETDGQRRSRIEVIVNDLDFMSSRRNGNGDASYNQSSSYSGSDQAPAYGSRNQSESFAAPAPKPSTGGSSQDRPTQAPPSSDVYDEDIPF